MSYRSHLYLQLHDFSVLYNMTSHFCITVCKQTSTSCSCLFLSFLFYAQLYVFPWPIPLVFQFSRRAYIYVSFVSTPRNMHDLAYCAFPVSIETMNSYLIRNGVNFIPVMQSKCQTDHSAAVIISSIILDAPSICITSL